MTEENHECQSVFLINQQTEVFPGDTASIEIPDLFVPITISGLLDCISLDVLIDFAGTSLEIGINPGCLHDLDFDAVDNPDRFHVKFLNQCVVHNIVLNCVSMKALPAILDKDILTRNPIWGYRHGFQFETPLRQASGWESPTTKQVQLKKSDGHVTTISKSNDNFKWKGNTLCCNLSSGNYFVRMRYKVDDRWIDWSHWLKVNITRKGFSANGVALE